MFLAGLNEKVIQDSKGHPPWMGCDSMKGFLKNTRLKPVKLWHFHEVKKTEPVSTLNQNMQMSFPKYHYYSINSHFVPLVVLSCKTAPLICSMDKSRSAEAMKILLTFIISVTTYSWTHDAYNL